MGEAKKCSIDAVVGIPDEGGLCTAVQLIVRGNPVLIFGSGLHAAVLENYLSLHRIPFAFTFDEEMRAHNIKQKVLYRSGRDYQLVGAGRALVNIRDRKIEFFGDSAGYEIGIDEEHLHIVASMCRGWEFERTDKY